MAFPFSAWAGWERFVKFVVKGEIPLGDCAGMGGGLGLNLGNNDHPINVLTTINYNSYRPEGGEDVYKSVGFGYKRLSVPIEVYRRLLDEEGTCFFYGAGIIYHYNFSGELYELSDFLEFKEMANGINPYYSGEDYVALRDGFTSHSFAVRISGGMTWGLNTNSLLGVKLFVDFDITSSLNKYSISDRLFEHWDQIGELSKGSRWGLSLFYTF